MMYEELGKAVYELLTLGQPVFVMAGSGDSILIAALERLPKPKDYLVLGELTDKKPQNGYGKAIALGPKGGKMAGSRERVSGLEPLTCCLGSYLTENTTLKPPSKTTTRRRR